MTSYQKSCKIHLTVFLVVQIRLSNTIPRPSEQDISLSHSIFVLYFLLR